LTAVTAAEAAGGAAVGVGVGAGVEVGAGVGVDVAEVVGVPLLELLLDPQPLIADTKINASGANAVNALDRYAIATCSYLFVIHADCEQPSVSSQRRRSGHPRKPRYLYSQTGSFASPACTGYALERARVNHAICEWARCRSAQTGAKISSSEM
jgi:hypothetical protein